MNILLIAGGWSSEREVALNGGKAIKAALEHLGHNVTTYDPETSLEGLPKAIKGQEFAFINLHGSPGEDGIIQAILERYSCPYQGANPAASMLALDKSSAKICFVEAGLRVAPSIFLHSKPAAGWQPDLTYPLFIKANTGGSSLHMEKVDTPDALAPALDRLFGLENSYIMETAISGMEVTCAVLSRLEGDRETAEALPPILIKPTAASGIFDYTSKYAVGGAEELCPAPISEQLTNEVQQMALKAHAILGVEGYSRADFIVNKQNEPYLLEVNTLPGMTATSLIPKAAQAAGLSFEDLVKRLIELGLARAKRQGR